MSATPLVLLPGWGMAPTVWAGWLPALARPALTPALPPVCSADLADHAEALLAHLPERMILAGWSFGGQLALHMAAHHPQRVEKLVLIGSTPRFVATPAACRSELVRSTPATPPDSLAPWPHGLAADTVEGFCRDFAADPAAVQKRFVALQALGDTARRSVVAQLTPALLAPTAANLPALSAGLACLAATDLRSLCPQLRQPTLILHGEADALMPADAARWLAGALPQARLQILPGCGHAPFLSQPQACATALEAFL